MTVSTLIAFLQTQPPERRIVLWEDLYMHDNVNPRTEFILTTEGRIDQADRFTPYAEEVVTL